MPSLENLQDNMLFPDDNDNTSALPTDLTVPVLVARSLTTNTTTSIVNVNDEQKPQVVDYAFLDPRHKSTTGVKNMAIRAGKWIETAHLRFDILDADDGVSSNDYDSGYGGEDGEGSDASSVESEDSVGSEGSAASYGSYGGQGSQTSVSSAESDHYSDDDASEDEGSGDEENDWDDEEEDDPYGEVEDDDMEFD